MNDDLKLKELLQTWQVDVSPSAQFQRDVWCRIATTQGSRTSRFLRAVGEWFVVSLPKPLYASAFVSVFVLSGLVFANSVASRSQNRQTAAMEQRYLASIDPVYMANNTLHQLR